MKALVALMALVAAGLVGIVGYELSPSMAEADRVSATVGAPAARVGDVPVRMPGAPAATTAASDDALLGRPLFSQTRRPPDVAGPVSAGAASAEPLPRMTAILIDGPNRRAIFVSGQGKTITVAEGGRLGAFTVQSIGPRQVMLVGPDGPRTVRTTFDAGLAAPAALPAASFVPPQFPGIQFPGSPPPGVPPSFSSQPAMPGFNAGGGSSPGAAR